MEVYWDQCGLSWKCKVGLTSGDQRMQYINKHYVHGCKDVLDNIHHLFMAYILGNLDKGVFLHLNKIIPEKLCSLHHT